MLDRLANGFLGLFLFLSQWLSPGGEQDDVRIVSAHKVVGGYQVVCAMALPWNDQMTNLVDAGIAVRFEMSSWSDAGDSSVFIRTLRCDLTDYTYSFSDSVITGTGPRVDASRSYPQVLIALRDYSRWKVRFSDQATQCTVQARLLTSRATRLDRDVDMSNVCGCRIFRRQFVRTSLGADP